MIYRNSLNVDLDYFAGLVNNNSAHPVNAYSTGLLAVIGGLLFVVHAK